MDPSVRAELSGSGGDRDRLSDRVDVIAADEGLSGVIRIDVDGRLALQRAFGLAHRGLDIPTTVDTQFATASGTKGLTALTVMSLVEAGELGLDTTARSVLGADLPLIDDRVTVEQLLAHRSGIGDYLDEDEVTDTNDYVMTVPVHELATTEQYLVVLDGHPMKYEPGERFNYCNGCYVVLALLAERAAGVPFHDLVEQRVCGPAGMTDTSFLRSDELPGRAAVGYLDDEGLRSNVLHLPVRGNGDGGIYTTAADVHAMWDAMFAGRIVSLDTAAEMVRPRSDVPEESMRYGLGFWLDASTGAVSLHGFDAGVGFVSIHDRDHRFTFTVLSNKNRGAWPVSRRLARNTVVIDSMARSEQTLNEGSGLVGARGLAPTEPTSVASLGTSLDTPVVPQVQASAALRRRSNSRRRRLLVRLSQRPGLIAGPATGTTGGLWST